MPLSKLTRALARSAVVSWREEPSQQDIEALRANIERVGVVIRVRWAIVAVLVAYSVVAAAVYAAEVPVPELAARMVVPALALAFVVVYNAIYQLIYRRVGNAAFLTHGQLALDTLVATVLVYYSGSIHSWFASMYLLFILEATFILPRRSGPWMIAGLAAVMYSFLVLGELGGLIPHVDVPFIANKLHGDATFVLVRLLWELALFGGTAVVGSLMMARIRARESELRGSSFVDELTGLYTRPYFHRVLIAEIERARRTDRSVALVFIDIYRFGEFNRLFGVEMGDAAIEMVARQIREAIREDADRPNAEMDTACRVGGEEFALIIPEIEREQGGRAAVETRAFELAETIRARVSSVLVQGATVTVSIGIATFPETGDTPDALIDAVDTMLWIASEAGGNTVRAEWLQDGEGSHDAEDEI